MKLLNLFKKSTKIAAKANVEKLEKKQLEKVVGGLDVTKEFSSAEEQLKSNPRH